MKKILITQSNYIPWKGYIDNILQCDVFVIYDDMQYTKRDWRNRNYIKTPSGIKWLTIPVEVSGKYFQKVNETVISDKSWNEKHWGQIQQNYRNAPYFKEYASWVEGLYSQATFEFLTEINVHFLKAICKFFNSKVEFRDSREFTLASDRNLRLVRIIEELGGTDYLTGPAAKSYLDVKVFNERKINVSYSDYSNYKEYPQLYPPFDHKVSIFDLIFNAGEKVKSYLSTSI